MDNVDILTDLFKTQSFLATTSLQADELIIIVDRSGSMIDIFVDAQGGINSFIEDNQKKGAANLTLVEFDNHINLVYGQVDINKVEPYMLIPRGLTAMYDAIGQTLANAEELQTTGKKIVVIVTDGHENCSREWTKERVFTRINSLKDAGWNFLFLAANQDALKTGVSLGVSAGSTIQYTANTIGTRSSYAAAANYTTALRGGESLFAVEKALSATIAEAEGLSRSDIVKDKTDE